MKRGRALDGTSDLQVFLLAYHGWGSSCVLLSAPLISLSSIGLHISLVPCVSTLFHLRSRLRSKE